MNMQKLWYGICSDQITIYEHELIINGWGVIIFVSGIRWEKRDALE